MRTQSKFKYYIHFNFYEEIYREMDGVKRRTFLTLLVLKGCLYLLNQNDYFSKTDKTM